MSYLVKEADIVKDKDTLLSILKNNRHRKDFPYEKRLDWLYFNNPFGKAIAWIIWDEKNDFPAGFTAVYPRKMVVHKKEYLCWNCGDFSIEKKYRSLGIAVSLRKAATRHVDKGDIPFLYAHPNDRMVHIHIRAGHKKIAKMKRFAFPIQVSKYVEKNPIGRIIGKSMDPVISLLLKSKFKQKGDYESLNQQQMSFDENHRSICELISDKIPVVGLRNEEYLNWKYKNHPIYDYTLFNYYENGRLAGFLIYHEENSAVSITEMVCPVDERLQQNLLYTFINFVIKNLRHISVISIVVQEFNPITVTLRDSGFKFRDDATSDVIAYCSQPDLRDIILDGKNWYMNVGDRDA